MSEFKSKETDARKYINETVFFVIVEAFNDYAKKDRVPLLPELTFGGCMVAQMNKWKSIIINKNEHEKFIIDPLKATIDYYIDDVKTPVNLSKEDSNIFEEEKNERIRKKE